ncbi:hypothetical protein QTP88_003012 [Uroleucon formosanum]
MQRPTRQNNITPPEEATNMAFSLTKGKSVLFAQYRDGNYPLLNHGIGKKLIAKKRIDKMCRPPFKYNLTFIVLFFGITLIHAGDDGEETSKDNIELYCIDWSVPCRAVMMLGKLLDIPFKMIPVDLEKHEQFTPAYEKINPLHQVPAINDNGFVLFESGAILVYLSQKFRTEKNKNLIPHDVQKRATVNKMLEFEMGTLRPAFNNLHGLWVVFKSPRTEFKLTKLIDAIQALNTLLEDNFAAGGIFTVSDVALFATILTIEAANVVDLSMYKNINKWYNNCQKELTDYQKVNEKGLDILKSRTENRNKDKKEEVEGLISNNDVYKAVSTLLRGIETQVISPKHAKPLKPLKDELSNLVNPLLKVPAINDKGFFLFESRAIIVYLVQKYGEGDQSNLYSEDLQIQANINKMLEFDLTTLGDAFINLYSPWIFYKTPKTEYKINNLKTALAFFENLLVDDYAVGKSLTVADVALASNIVTIQAIGEDISHYKKITEWLARCEKNIKEFMEVNAAGIEFAKIKADHRRNEDINDLFDGSVSNSDILQAISTLTRGVQTQVISTKYLKHFESLKTRLLLLG